MEGHLDDTYYQYTSLFHSGRLSPNDNKFLIQIRAFVTPEPGFPIDNPSEVIAAMREEDFRQSYVLNVKLVDSLMSDRSRHLEQVQKLFEFLSSEFESCEGFFEAYYASGSHVGGLISGLVDAWKGSEHRDLQVLFVATNIDAYLADPDSFSLDDDFRENLLRSRIENVAKQEIVKLMDLTALAGLPERSALIGPIINDADVKTFNLDGTIAQSLVEQTSPIATQISLFNKCHSFMTNDEVRQVLSKLPRPFSEIKTGYGIPRLENNPDNQDLVKWLDSRDIISSWSEGSFFSNDIRVNLYRS
ncbi:hypothetical protein [Ruegeria sp. HKCCD6228]|uniref:hypothetical protein n=1 Tax=Ruegeria sp. HKCCD6228 TaxID=2683001 RepID=UPI001C12861E|nr:hypothetical protein [Ruegeria sp. HKCCD6228]